MRLKSGQWLSLHFFDIDSIGRDGMLAITGTKGAYVSEYEKFTIHKITGDITSSTTRPNPPGRQELYYQNVAHFLAGKADLVLTAEWARRPIHILDLAGRSA